MISQLAKLAAQYPQIYEKITGRGLLNGVHFKTKEVGFNLASGLFKKRMLVAGTLKSAQTVRIERPLIVEMQNMDALLDRLRAVFSK